MTRRWIAMLMGTLLSAASAQAAAAAGCGLCATAVTIDRQRATCFLGKFEALASRGSPAVAVDLSDCVTDGEDDRSIIDPLPAPGAPGAIPDSQFILSLSQLVCLKRKLEAPGLVLEPAATIDLGDCE
ncbi:MAG: hypothetical protein WAT70_06295 [Rhizobiaceae bacterium]